MQHERIVVKDHLEQPLHGRPQPVGADLLAVGHLAVYPTGDPLPFFWPGAEVDHLDDQVALAIGGGGAVGRVAIDLAAHQPVQRRRVGLALNLDAGLELRRRRPRRQEGKSQDDSGDGIRRGSAAGQNTTPIWASAPGR